MSVPSPASAKSILDTLAALYPVFNKHLPLAINTKAELAKAHPELGSKDIATALRYYTGSTSYLKSAQSASHRYDLQGNPCEEMTEEHRQYAAGKLKDRFKKKAEARKLAEKTKAAQEAEQKKTEKLGQLLAKFGKK